MKTLVRAGAVLGLAGSLWATPGISQASDAPRRVSDLSGSYPGLSAPDRQASGRAVLTMHRSTSTICYTFRWSGMNVRNLDVYRRSTGQFVTELYDEAPVDGPSVAGCVDEIPGALIRELTEHPARFSLKAASYYNDEQIGGTLRRPAR